MTRWEGEVLANSVLTVLAIVLVGFGTCIDFARHRLPNWLTINGFLLALALQGYVEGWTGFSDGLIGAAVPFAVFFPFFVIRWMGAGDVKLAMAAGCCMGWPLSLVVCLNALLIGSFAAFAILLARGGLAGYLKRYGLMLACLLRAGRFAYLPPDASETAATTRFPYAFVIALGLLTVILWPGELAFIHADILLP